MNFRDILDILTIILLSGVVFGLILMGVYFKQKTKELDKEWEEVHRYARELKEHNIEQAQKRIAVLEEESRKQLQIEYAQFREQAMRSVNAEVEREYERKVATMKEALDKYTEYVDDELDEEHEKLSLAMNFARDIRTLMNKQLEDTASQLISLTEAERNLLLEEEALRARMLQLPEEERNDIELLMNELLPRIKRPELVRKLVWTEYIQRPTTLLLNTIVPQDCAGIYKITHLPDKKCYIGRSTSVRKRLTEHIKSSLGVGTIADQQVHHAMRKEGLHNFMFELIEECDKDILAAREKFYIDKFQANKWGYNGNVGG